MAQKHVLLVRKIVDYATDKHVVWILIVIQLIACMGYVGPVLLIVVMHTVILEKIVDLVQMIVWKQGKFVVIM